MRPKHSLALGALVAALVLGMGLVVPAQSQPPAPAEGGLSKELASSSKIGEQDVSSVLAAIGPAIAAQISSGKEVSLPGLGTFRVVRLAQSRNLENGRVVTQPARNVVEFIPDPSLEQAANAPGAEPAAEVPAFQYVPFPGQTPGQRIPSGSSRSPSTRVR